MKNLKKTEDLVTVVRRRVVYDEVCIPFSEFNQLSKDISNSKSGASWDCLDFELDTCPDLCDGTQSFVAFEGDIYTMTDDVIAHGGFDMFSSIDHDVDIEKPIWHD